MEKNTWICEAERVLITSPVIDIVERDCRSSEDDRTHRFYLMRSRDWCNIIPVTEDGKIVMVKQYRIGISEHTTELPGGVADASDESLQAAAIREMTEETGYAPLPGARCVPLGWAWSNPAMLNNRTHAFVIGPVGRTQEQKLDTGEMIEVVEIAPEDIPEMIARGELNHALHLNTLLFLMLQSPNALQGLREGIAGFAKV